MKTVSGKKMSKLSVFKSRTEALTQLFFSHYVNIVRETGKNHLIAEEIGELEKLGLSVKILPMGQLRKEVFLEMITPRTSLLSLSWSDPFTGVIHPLEELSLLCREKGIVLHVDITTTLGRLDFRFEDINADFLTYSGKEKTLLMAAGNFTPLFFEEIEADYFEIEVMHRQFDHLCTETARLRTKFEDEIVANFPEAKILFQDLERVPDVSAISIPDIHTEALLFFLHRKGIELQEREGAMSFRFAYETTEEDVDHLLQEITSSAQKLQTIGAHL
jgi:cysteine desulfurase